MKYLAFTNKIHGKRVRWVQQPDGQRFGPMPTDPDILRGLASGELTLLTAILEVEDVRGNWHTMKSRTDIPTENDSDHLSAESLSKAGAQLFEEVRR